MNTRQDSNDLWMIMAVIQPFKLDDVTLALEQLPHFGGMTVSDCRGFGRGKVAHERGAAEDVQRAQGLVIDFTGKARLEIAVSGRADVDSIVEAIARAAHTGNPGDGKVFVWPLQRAVRVRTFDEADRAV